MHQCLQALEFIIKHTKTKHRYINTNALSHWLAEQEHVYKLLTKQGRKKPNQTKTKTFGGVSPGQITNGLHSTMILKR